ncbi:hypothetical protein [Nocardioides ungokensis]|uniref:hypothetical protein n=1 Tax=Nocardioides ungokensis TaxID=1643322 RepID=UPI0015DFB991|nr:hypothetical protein [Nocardioides ungokensis]
MSFYDEPFDPTSAKGAKLMELALIGFEDKAPLKLFVAALGVAPTDINWDQSVKKVWGEALTAIAALHRIRDFLLAAKADENYAAGRDDIIAFIAVCDAESAAGVVAAPPTLHELARTTLVGLRPFVNRVQLRDNLVSLFDPDGARTMVVGGPRFSGRSYTWVLASHVARRFSGMDTKLIDLTTFTDAQATPVDVARMIADSLEWTDWPKPADIDPTAQDATNARILRPQLVNRLSGLGPVCLFFDGLDGSNLTEATVEFVADIAAAAGNDELGECRVVLLAFDRAIPNPNVDPFVLREPPLADIPLTEVTSYFQQVAKEAHTALTDTQAAELVVTVFGSPAPDPVPISTIRANATKLSAAARGLKGGA